MLTAVAVEKIVLLDTPVRLLPALTQVQIAFLRLLEAGSLCHFPARGYFTQRDETVAYASLGGRALIELLLPEAAPLKALGYIGVAPMAGVGSGACRYWLSGEGMDWLDALDSARAQ